MTHAKVKNERLDAQLLAKLLAAAMLPGMWVCDEQTRILRRQVTRRSQYGPRGRSASCACSRSPPAPPSTQTPVYERERSGL
jgi:hypothetical protein